MLGERVGLGTLGDLAHTRAGGVPWRCWVIDEVELDPQGDAVRATLREIRANTGLPVAFIGVVGPRILRLEGGVGLRTPALKGLDVLTGSGLGGHVLNTGRAAAVVDYCVSSGITAEYRSHVAAESLRSMIAVPLMVDRRLKAVFYAADHTAVTFGDGVRKAVATAVRGLSDELRIRREVNRRVQYAEAAAVEHAPGVAGADREMLRELYSELRVIAGQIGDQSVRDRLEGACGQLADFSRSDPLASTLEPEPMRTGPQLLSAREIDVLSQVALGCTNIEVAQRLSLKPETVKAYLRNAGQKLGTRTRFESVTRARSLGILP